MLPNPPLDKLQTLRLQGMIKALGEQHATPDIDDLSFDERLGLMVDRELSRARKCTPDYTPQSRTTAP